MQLEALILKIIISAVPIIFAITVHEASHGYAAKYFGDLTAERMGRISLNPFRHIDLVGTILLPALTLIVGGILFGWAKPVPVNFNNLRNPKKDMLWVAAAGPASNLLMAIAWGILLGFVKRGIDAGDFPSAAYMFIDMAYVGITINIVLMVLNLLPMPPLDGGRIAVSLLPHNLGMQLSRLEQYGFLILIALMFMGVLGKILSPFIEFFQQIIFRIFV
ncbi:MAG TPA: site-2 protease family protein [Methylotenera sp.]|nr:site-2 protease family protein [Methylotenera sp.]